MTKIAESAIARSISHNEIVVLDYDSETYRELSAASEGGVNANGVTEYWGVTDEGDEWRVHLRGVAVTDRQIRALESEAGEAGDALQVYICRVALGASYSEAELNDDSCLDAEERRTVVGLSREDARDICDRAIRSAMVVAGEVRP